MYRFWIDGDQCKTLIESDEPYIYDKFWKSSEHDSQLKAMKSEMDSIMDFCQMHLKG